MRCAAIHDYRAFSTALNSINTGFNFWNHAARNRTIMDQGFGLANRQAANQFAVLVQNT